MTRLLLALLSGCAQPAPTYTRAPNVLLVDDVMGAPSEALVERFGQPCIPDPMTWPVISNTVLVGTCWATGWVLEVRIRDGVAVWYGIGEGGP